MDVAVLSKTTDDATVKKMVTDLSNAMQGIKTSTSSEAAALRTINLDGDTFVLNKVQTVGLVTGLCHSGAVLGVDSSNTNTNGKCGKQSYHYELANKHKQ